MAKELEDPRVVAIGASAGGPEAFQQLIEDTRNTSYGLTCHFTISPVGVAGGVLSADGIAAQPTCLVETTMLSK